MAEVRVRLPLGAHDFRVWESMAFRSPRRQTAGSDPAILTSNRSPPSDERGCRARAVAYLQHCGGSCTGTGGRLLIASMQVRFLPPQLYGRSSRLATAPRSNRDELHGLEGSTPSPSASSNLCPWPSGKGSRLPTWRGGFDSRRALYQLRNSDWRLRNGFQSAI